MTLLIAASASGTAGALALLAVAAGGYVVGCVVWPFTKCRRCDGIGRHHSPGRAYWRDCRRCRGTGARVRLGRRVYAKARGLHTDGSRPLGRTGR